MPQIDNRRKYSDAVEYFANLVGAKLDFTVKHGHLEGELTLPPDAADPSEMQERIEALEALIYLVEIGTAHICPACGVDAGLGEAVEEPGGELMAECLGCGRRRIVD